MYCLQILFFLKFSSAGSWLPDIHEVFSFFFLPGCNQIELLLAFQIWSLNSYEVRSNSTLFFLQSTFTEYICVMSPYLNLGGTRDSCLSF